LQCRTPARSSRPQWLQIRQAKPDWVILRGWGVDESTALKAAANWLPARHIIAYGGRAPKRT